VRPRRAPHIEQTWCHATLEQIADLHVWLHQRLPERDSDAIAAWVLAVSGNEGKRSNGSGVPSGRRLKVFREILDRYGPPRAVTSSSLEL
jgi:hypothetical protein